MGDTTRTGQRAGDEDATRVPTVRARPGLVQIFPRSLEAAPATWATRATQQIGRGSAAAIRLSDKTVSRAHASVSSCDGGVRVTDLDSRYGTFVNGVRAVRPTIAGVGSVIRCGDTLLLIVDDCDAYAATHRLRRDFLRTPRDVVGGPSLWRVWQRATQAAELGEPILILGESGTGKDVLARLIHATRCRDDAFVPINVAAIPPGLFESELFGHERGAFTGAIRAKLGAFREAAGGVLFLDEVGDLAPDLQVKLLRAIETRSARPVGGDRDFPCDARIVSATSRDLESACREQRFRPDLYYRLSGIVIEMPPLRERPDDVILLALDTLQQEARPAAELSVEAAELLALASWRGNVRELQNALTHARMELASEGGTKLLTRHFELASREDAPIEEGLTAESVRIAMEKAGGNASRAAKSLGVSRATLYNFCGRAGLNLAAVRAEARAEHDPPEAKAN